MGKMERASTVAKLVEVMLSGLSKDKPVEPFLYMEKNLLELVQDKIKTVQGRPVINSNGEWCMEIQVETCNGSWQSSTGEGRSSEVEEMQSLRGMEEGCGERDKVRCILAEEIPPIEERLRDAAVGRIDEVITSIMLDSHIGIYLGSVGWFCLSASAWRASHPALTGPLPVPVVTIYESTADSKNLVPIEEIALIVYSDTLHSSLALVRKITELLKPSPHPPVGPRGGFVLPSDASLVDVLTDVQQAIDVSTEYYERVKVVVHFGRGSRDVGSPFAVIDECKRNAKLGLLHAVVDPFNAKEVDGWGVVKLLNFLLIGDEVVDRTHIISGNANIPLDMCTVRLTRHHTITALASESAQLHGKRIKTILRTETHITPDTLPAELAMHLSCHWAMLGGLYSGDRTMLWNSLLRVEDEYTLRGTTTYHEVPPEWL